MSAILSADDLNDFITPGVACIKPVETLPNKQHSENPYEVTTEEKAEVENAPPAQISLTDCLACSGCVTSAEAVLISLQSHAEVLDTLDAHPEFQIQSRIGPDAGITPENGKIFVASVSPQVRASLAATYGISERKAGYIVEQFLSGASGLRAGGRHGNGFTWVVDTNVMREVVLELSASEVAETLSTAYPGASAAATASDDFPVPRRPILSSACPGWICYAEKTHPHVLPHLSRLKSPQALTGIFLKTVLSKALNIHPSRIWHLAIMPCFDKKLEASRQELTDAAWQQLGADSMDIPQSPTRDVDCVITPRELITLASSRGISLTDLPQKPLPFSHTPPFPDPTIAGFLFPNPPRAKLKSLQSEASGTSGGYLHYVLSTFQSWNPRSSIQTQRGRNADVVEYTLVAETGAPILKAARYYGFRNIQNLVRKLKPASSRMSKLPGASSSSRRLGSASRAIGGPSSPSEYAYIEVMACPGGCTNGGGQIRLEELREISARVNSANTNSAAVLEEEMAGIERPKPTANEQRAWLARVDEAYFSADSDNSEFDSMDVDDSSRSEGRSSTELFKGVEMFERTDEISSVLGYWVQLTGIPLSKLVYTTFRRVESDVGKDRVSTGAMDTARVAELAGKIGGGW